MATLKELAVVCDGAGVKTVPVALLHELADGRYCGLDAMGLLKKFGALPSCVEKELRATLAAGTAAPAELADHFDQEVRAAAAQGRSAWWQGGTGPGPGWGPEG